MKVLIAKTSGFCDGVRRAMRIALDASKHGEVWADGPLVHNRQALELLALHGLGASPEPGPEQKFVLIRAHGAAPESRSEWMDKGLEIVDATCAHVARNQRLVSGANGLVVLAGDPGHAEVLAVAAAAKECIVVQDARDIESLPASSAPVLLLAQTTFNADLFHRMADAMRRRFPESTIIDTICRATHVRQEEARRLADLVEVMVVVGGRHSANTGRLADMAREAGKPVFLVETADDLLPEDFAPYRVAGVTSGASTPGWVTQEVVNRLKGLGRDGVWGKIRLVGRTLIEARIGTALSGGGLALAAQFMSIETIRADLALAGAGYVFFAHTLNRRLPPSPEARRLTLADGFYQRKRSRLLPLAWLAAGAAMVISATEGLGIFLLFLGAFAATIGYTRLSRRIAVRAGANQYPVLRTLVMAAGWGLILAGPAWLLASGFGFGTASFLFVFFICVGGTLIRDLHDIASDRLMGLDTMPARLGEKRGSSLAQASLIAAALVPLTYAFWPIFQPGVSPARMIVPLLASAPAWGREFFDLQRRGFFHDALRVQAGVDSVGWLAGILAMAGYLWAG